MENERKLAKPRPRPLYDAVVVIVLLNSLGFPGNYMELFGSMLGTLVDYGCFGAEILLMLLSSGDELLDIKLVDLKAKYRGIYLVVFVFFLESMLVTAYPGEQFITCLRLSTTIFFVLWICDWYDLERILRLICTAQTVFVAFALALVALRPGLAFNSVSGERAFVGLHTTKNAAAKELALGIILFLVYFKSRCKSGRAVPKIFYAVLALQIILLVMCRAVGSLLTLLVTVFYVLFLMDKLGPNRRIPLAWMFVLVSVGFLIAALTIFPLFSGFFEMLGKDATLTGRTPLWEAVIDMMQESHTLTGYGYAMFWRDEAAVETLHGAFSSNSFLGTMNTGAHNLLLELWLNVGLLGIAALFLGMFDCMKRIRELTDLQYAVCAAIFIFCMINGLTERSFASTYYYDVSFLFLAMGIACNRQNA